MKTYTQTEINKILELHKLWLNSGGKKGSRADFTGADLRWNNFTKANFTNANFTGANLSDTDFTKVDLGWANFTESNLSGADFTKVDLSNANFTKADLCWVNFTKADLSVVNFTGADLRYTNFTKANLSCADLTGADLLGIKGKFIFTFQIGKHFGYYCDGNVRIGCECHSLNEWLSKGKEIGRDNGYTEVEISNYLKTLKFIKYELT